MILQKEYRLGYRLRPYLLITLVAVIACLPLISTLFTLKNDVVAIEFPVQYFISEALRHGENPVWFNSWCMGFPLQSVLTWSVFSTPRSILGALLPSDILVLHLEFLFYIISAGAVMFALLKNHFSIERNMALLLSCCYMLSGFTVGSSQWLLYLTGLSFIPLVFYAALSLLRRPGFLNVFFLATAWYLLLTNVHIYLTVVTGYIVVFFFSVRLFNYWTNKAISVSEKKKLTRMLCAALLLTIAFSAAPIYYTLELLPWLERRSPLIAGQDFFQSNYLHPAEGLKSLLLPLSTVRSSHANTEGSIQTIYMGLLPLLLFIPSLRKNFKEKNKSAGWILFFSIFFLVLSFGHLTPLRNGLNILPGMSYFRHPGVLRAFFIMGFIIYLGVSFKGYSLASLLKPDSAERKILIASLIFTGVFLMIFVILRFSSLGSLWKGDFYNSFLQADNIRLEALNGIIQVLTIAALLFAVFKKTILLPAILILELIFHFLCCAPFYMLSSHSVSEVNQLFSYTRGFPVQSKTPYHLPVDISDNGNTVWRNTNTFQKNVSTEISMPGPLVLEKAGHFLSSPGKDALSGKALVFISGESLETDTVNILHQGSGKVAVAVQLSAPRKIVLQQCYFPGWEVYYNGKVLPLIKSEKENPFIIVEAPAGKGDLVFQFKKNGVLYSALLMHGIMLAGLFIACRRFFRFRSSSPSSQY